MENTHFYKILDEELNALIKEHSSDVELKKKEKDISQLKSYSFMNWILNFYGKGVYGNKRNIIDGPEDSSCDIIFQKYNFEKEEIFYVVQSKWNEEQNVNKQIDSTEIKKTLNDFQTILSGEKEKTKNEKFNEALKDLKKHLKKNGKVEFLFISLCKFNPDANDNLKAFNNSNPNMQVRVFDIEHIKRDFIDVRYKKLDEQNLLERKFNPKEEEITIQIERLGTNNNQIIIQKPYDAMIVLIRPKFLYELFEKYGYSLLIENVRNPIKNSDFNKKIMETLKKSPANFWYYNNGITAITKSLPTVGKQAKEFNINGLQIINGAQTLHAIHTVYSQSTTNERKSLDELVLLTMRLYKSAGEDFDRLVTKFTNAQNPMDDRDFWANDPVQIRLQNESFNTKYWYEKRRDEFVIDGQIPNEIEILSNKYMARAYASFFMQIPYISYAKELFKSKKEDNSIGFYEMIFDENANFKKILTSYLLFRRIDRLYPNFILDHFAHTILALFKITFEKYLGLKYDQSFDSVDYILKKLEKYDYSEIDSVVNFIANLTLKKFTEAEITEDNFSYNKFPNLKVEVMSNFPLTALETQEEIENQINIKTDTLTFHLTDSEVELLKKEVSGVGGWQTLMKNLQDNIDGNYLTISTSDVSKIISYGKGNGGYQSRISSIYKKLENLGKIIQGEDL